MACLHHRMVWLHTHMLFIKKLETVSISEPLQNRQHVNNCVFRHNILVLYNVDCFVFFPHDCTLHFIRMFVIFFRYSTVR